MWYVFGVVNDDDIGRRYPHILFSRHWNLSPPSNYLLGRCDAIVDSICRIPLQPNYRETLLSVSLVKGAQATTAIEGNTLTEAEIEQIAGGESLPQSKEYQEREVKNILDAMNQILDEVAYDGRSALVTADLIKRFHRLVGAELGERFDAIPGHYRTDARIVGPYRCPQPEHIEELVRRMCDWLQREFGYGKQPQSFADAVVQAMVTHVYLEWIHPFGDGNGRTGRLLEFYVLLRAGNPDIVSHILSNHYNQTRTEYYRQLDNASKTRDLTEFLDYAIAGYHDGLREVLTTISWSQFQVSWLYLVHTKFANTPYRKKTVFKRRRGLALAMPQPNKALLPDEIMVQTPELARQYAHLTPRTLLRDLEELRKMNLIVGTDDGRYRINGDLLVPHFVKRRIAPAGAVD